VTTTSGMPGQRVVADVLGTPVDAVTLDEVVARIAAWAQAGDSRCVCACNVHSVATAASNEALRRALAEADLNVPDGAPVAWLMRHRGLRGQRRVSGPDLMLAYFEHAASRGESVYLYGSTDATLSALAHRLRSRWPGLRIAGMHAPPFRPTTDAEDEDDVQRIHASGARTVWVGLGCPKQELWAAARRDRVQAVMVGVGAAFDFHAGTVPRAPRWMRSGGLEWLHRLLQEPGRLTPRYLVTSTWFLAKVFVQLLRRR
jgi:N-acetylglucosaminyldiphosphoundecaprenol N-acetyl-beta-D-mannosaminyltransferase